MTLHDRTLLLALAGSRAHGTHSPESDVDLLGVALPTARALLGVHERFEQENDPEALAVYRGVLPRQLAAASQDTKLEGTVYALDKLLRLAESGNPSVLELLFTRESELLVQTELGARLRESATLFLSERCRQTFGGYAARQLSRIQLHHRWHHQGPERAPTRAEFGLPERERVSSDALRAAESEVRKQLESWEVDLTDLEPATRLSLQTQLEQTLAQWKLASEEARWEAAGRWIGVDTHLMELMKLERRWRSARGEWKRYQAWKRNRNPQRAELEARFGYDTKHGAHLVRLMRMGQEILREGTLHVWRGDRDADELLAIRGGAWSYERLLEWADQARQELNGIEAVVPPKPDRQKVEDLCVGLTRAALDSGRLE
ncbi:MAG: nucleotidyltransferase domain-containing protein [Myxococcota bacterium]|nr:nucleotidyltransferase domain-containing protein [Myxococcota bacterium]